MPLMTRTTPSSNRDSGVGICIDIALFSGFFAGDAAAGAGDGASMRARLGSTMASSRDRERLISS